MNQGAVSAGKNAQRGITLIEVLVVVVILGIVSAVAVPVYTAYMREARRSDARSALTEIAAQQAEYVLNHSEYADDPTLLGLSTISENGFYTLATDHIEDNVLTFEATATARAEQANDTHCATFFITHTGAKTAETSGAADSTADCW